MVHVFRMGTPFKVFRAVIGFVTVDVIHAILAGRRLTIECKTDKTMDQIILSSAIMKAERDTQIAISPQCRM